MTVIADLIGTHWELIEPFTRSDIKTLDDLRDGETEIEVCEEFIYVVENNGEPPLCVHLTDDEVEFLKSDPIGFRDKDRILYRSKSFLWVITENSLLIVREQIRNVKRTLDPDYICHTNLTGGKRAYVAGEILFAESGEVYINKFSDRYGGRGTPDELWEAAKDVFRSLGYPNVYDFEELAQIK